MIRSPLFIIGASRSGTTMFRLLLNSHSAIHIPPEAWFLGDLVCAFSSEATLDSVALARARKIIVSNDRWPTWRCSDETLDRALTFESPPTLGVLIDRLFSECAGVGDKPIWGEKSPRHSYLVPQLRRIFPEARFLHLIRDGRDSCISIHQRGWYDASFRRVCEHWSTAVRAACLGRGFGPAAYLEIRYEDLVRSPRETLQKVCTFLGIPFEEAMLNYTERIESDITPGEKTLHSSLAGGLHPEMIGKSRSAMSLWQRLSYEAICGEVAASVGYESVALAPWERALLPGVRLAHALDRILHAWRYRFSQGGSKR